MNYQEFLTSKIPVVQMDGFIPTSECPSWFKPHQSDCVHWAIQKGRSALFESFGLGKALKNGTGVLTPTGWKNIEELKIGDNVFGSNGETCNVTGVFPQGIRPTYRVTFSDRTHIDCDQDHLWYFQTQGQRYRGTSGKTYTTLELFDSNAAKRKGGTRLFVPMVDPVNFPEQSDLEFDPYTLGVLLGDGGFTIPSRISLTTDNAIVESLIFPEDCTAKLSEKITDNVSTYQITGKQGKGPISTNSTLNAIRKLGLDGKRSEEKWVPKQYLFASIQQRTDLLQGLLDTDGSASLSGTVEFGSASERLTKDVKFLVESLGGTAMYSIKKEPKYTHKGEDRIGLPSHRLHIKMPDGFEPFRLKRKQENMEPAIQRKNPHRALMSIERIDDALCTCISVDSIDRLFVTENFILTHNTVQQLQLMKWVHEHTGKKTLIVCPLGVRQEFTKNDGPRMGMKVTYCRTDAEVEAADTPYIITNYERVRDGGITVGQFGGATLDEGSCLRSYGTKTTQQFSILFQQVPFRWVATATPSPNEFIELINYAHFLGIMDRGQAMTRFFQRDSKKAGNLQLYPHEETRFWLWVAGWAVFVHRPSDLGYDDAGYDMPEMIVKWHEVKGDIGQPGEFVDSYGQPLLFEKPGGGIKHVAKQRRKTKDTRILKAAEIIAESPDDHWIVWHYLESERHEIQKAIPGCKSVYGSMELEQREQIVGEFANGELQHLSSKPQLLGSGCNFQRHCHKAVFIGPTDKFNDFIQACHRIYRFMQNEIVEIHIVFADTQYDTVMIMRKKWERHKELEEKMRQIILENGLCGEALKMKFERGMGVIRNEVSGKFYRAINNDCVTELGLFPDDSIDEIVTSIPFSDHYEYSPNYNDFGHNHGDDGFFKQFAFLVPELYRVLKPGRIACIHTKDRIQYGTMTGDAMYTVNEFSDKTVAAFKAGGFLYLGRIVIDTDVVRENAQTYRLGHTQNAADSTKMGCGSTEFVLIFRKWEPSMSPNQTANGPNPVTKSHAEYSRSRWQIHASGIWRSSGNELIGPEILRGMTTSEIYHWWRNYAKEHPYNYADHVAFTEAVEEHGHLPAAMMLFAPVSNNPDVWTDIVRIKTLNTELSRKTTENHVCPLQLDVIERLIERYSNPGDTILDPFGGVGSVAYQAIKMKRKGVSIELNPDYWKFSVSFCERAERKLNAPTLFDMEGNGEDENESETKGNEGVEIEVGVDSDAWMEL